MEKNQLCAFRLCCADNVVNVLKNAEDTFFLNLTFLTLFCDIMYLWHLMKIHCKCEN